MSSLNPSLYTPPKAAIGISEGCVLACRHCYGDCVQGAAKAGELDAAEWISYVDRIAEDGVVSLYVEGGEPLAKPGFLDVLRHASRSMFTMVRTHGTLIDDRMADSLKASGVGRIMIDVMGDNSTTHDWFSGVDGSFASSLEGARRIASRGIGLDLLIILTSQNADQLNGVLRIAAQLGASRVGVLRLYPLGRAKRIWSEIALSLPVQMAALSALDPPAGIEVMQSWHPNDHNCCWQAAAVNAFGRIVGCMYLREYVDHGDIRETTLIEAWRDNPLWRTIRSGNVEKRCGTCSTRQGSHGGCRSTAYAWHGRWSAPDPFDVNLNEGIDLVSPPDRSSPT